MHEFLSGDAPAVATDLAPWEPSRCVGRAPELALVDQLLTERGFGSGRAVLFGGGRGAGKSRLLHECARLRPSAVLLHASGAASQLGELARAPSRKPLLVLVDDVHGAGPEDARALEALRARAAERRLVLVGSFLEDAQALADGEVMYQAALDRGWDYRRLGPLDGAAMEVLIRGLARERRLGADGFREILEDAQGNPRLAVELARSASTAARSGTLLAPSALATVRMLRSKLSAFAFDVLSLCCIVPDPFRDDWIVDIFGAARPDVAAALQAAYDLGALTEDPRTPGSFSFRQAAVRKALAASLISLKRRLLSQRVAEFVTALPDGPRHAALAARYWELPPPEAPAHETLCSAAGHLAKSGAFAAAAEVYERAAQRQPQGTPEWFALRREIVRCYTDLG